MVERGKEIQSVQHILINMGKDNNSRTENNMYTYYTWYVETLEKEKEIQSIQHILINMEKRQQLTN